ncbi:flagellar motor protein MotD [Thiorhodospira sibirica]|uniref:flagellar motor protein MotD n=1 Tax=Thiorhodospira sibirica TaxID=154347 RepID=UPI00022C4C3F|nr:flagellar motor protein MotD [Thiorhodospira sibirica]
MAKKKKCEDHQNHEAWAIPYADLMTLLLAFFVVMYAISVVNEGKYRVLSDSLVTAFRAPTQSEPVPIGELGRRVPMSTDEPAMVIAPLDDQIPSRRLEDILGDMDIEGLSEAVALMSEMSDEIEEAMAPLIDADLINIHRDRLWIEVEINTSILFASGSATLSPEAIPVLQKLAEILARFPNRIHVEGHTDNVPISTVVYPSNWELSSGRAASVVHLFGRNGLDPEQMAAIGYGEFRPVADNATPEGRRKNRRVAVIIMAGKRQPTDTGRPELLREDVEMMLRRPASPEGDAQGTVGLP